MHAHQMKGQHYEPLVAALVQTQPAVAPLRGWLSAETLAFVQQVFNNKDHGENLYGEAVEVDYRGYEVTAENFLRVLTGPRPQQTPDGCLMHSIMGEQRYTSACRALVGSPVRQCSRYATVWRALGRHVQQAGLPMCG